MHLIEPGMKTVKCGYVLIFQEAVREPFDAVNPATHPLLPAQVSEIRVKGFPVESTFAYPVTLNPVAT